ncbi:MAG: pyridoxal-dependent decarboxylase [Rhodobacter sp.]|nr:pyridoxal-dependent decarboxylase [Rhodobacter sp.]
MFADNSLDAERRALEIGRSFLRGNADGAVVDVGHACPSTFPALPEAGVGELEALETYWSSHGGQHSRSSGPRYFGFVTGGVTPAALTADILVPYLDQNVATERHSIAAYIEELALAQVLDLLALPRDELSGVLVTGTSAANLACLAGARQWCGQQAGYDIAEDGIAGAPRITVFAGTPHTSIHKAMSTLGLGRRNLCEVPSLPGREAVDTAALAEALASRPGTQKIVVASAGTVNTGDFDALPEVADLCERHGAWLHVDGAFGAFARSLPEYAHLAAGMERADSLSVDGHKWLNLPYDCGLAFSRHMDRQEMSFSADAPYVPKDGTLPAFMNRAVEQSRRYRALPLYLSLQAYGRAGFRRIFEDNCRFARRLSDWIDASQDFERLAETRLNIVCFRGSYEDETVDARNRDLLQRINGSGRLFMTPTTYKGRFCFRLAASNWQTGDGDLNIVTDTLTQAFGSQTA